MQDIKQTWTDEDMVDFASYAYYKAESFDYPSPLQGVLKNWKDQNAASRKHDDDCTSGLRNDAPPTEKIPLPDPERTREDNL